MRKYTEQEIKKFISEPLFNERTVLEKDFSFPKISIITPSYNQKRFLEKTILSVLNQNYPNLELIIIDGGSTDGSVDIIKKYEKYLAYWVSEKDRGQSDGLNKGFKITAGEIIGWQNSDDIYLPDAFLKIADFFKQNSRIDIICGNRLDIDENDNIIGESRFTRFSPIVYQYDGISLGTQVVFWRKSLFSKIGYLDINLQLAMDYDFFLRAAKKEAKFKFIPYYLGAMRRHNLAKTEMFLGTIPHQKELDKIDKKYGRKNWLNFPLKIYSLFFRTVNYFFQGDIDYILKGFKRRIKRRTLLRGR
ncbi:glycosyltransferase [Candidatus Parcubacteria bacterium]|nr:glycosyltransferase [Candidatus Parcubacteria bacterium]